MRKHAYSPEVVLPPHEGGSERMRSNGPEHVEIELLRDSFGAYMQQAGKHELLNAEQEASFGKQVMAAHAATELLEELQAPQSEREAKRGEVAKLRRIKQLGNTAMDTLVTSNLRLVVSIAQKYSYEGEQLIDTIQDGNLGLMRASEKFDPTKGYRFTTYATWWVRQSIDRGRPLNNSRNATRFPVHLQLEMKKLNRAMREVGADEEEHPNNYVEAVASMCGLTEQKVKDLLRWRQQFTYTPSLNQPMGEETDTTLGDVTVDHNQKSPEAEALALVDGEDLRARIYNELDERSQQVLTLRFGLADGSGWSLQEIGDALGLTRERVRQIQVRSLEKLRRTYEPHAGKLS